MANLNWPNGMRPVSNPAGTAPQRTLYTRSSTGAIGEGALLYITDTGPAVWTGTATGGGKLLGPCDHFVAADDTEIYILDDPKQEFLMQGDTAIANELTAIGEFCGIIGNTTYVTTTLQSTGELDTSDQTSVGTTVLPLQIVRFWKQDDNDQDGADARWVVKIGNVGHRYGD